MLEQLWGTVSLRYCRSWDQSWCSWYIILANMCYELTIITNHGRLRLSSWIGNVKTTEWSHWVTLFSHHSHLCHCSWLYPYVIMILYGNRVKAPQCSRGHYGFINYHTVFIPEYSVPNWPEICCDEIMHFKGLYCTKVWNHFTISKKEKKIINPHWVPWKCLVLKFQLWNWNTHTCYGLGL